MSTGRLGRKRLCDSLDEEIREHIERETADNMERGMTPGEARSAALRKFGNVTRVKEDVRAVWSVVWLEQFLQDAGYGIRMFRRNRGFSMAVVLTLALGIGMNTAYQSEVDGRLLPSDYSSFRQDAKSFESMAAYSNQDLALVYRGDGAAERIASITGDLWSMAGAKPALGRLYRPGEPGAIVLSWQLFERRFAGDPDAIGKTVAVSGHPFEIVGVLPAHFRFLFPQFLYPDDERRDIDAYIAIPNAGLNLPMSAYRMDAWDKILEELGPTPDFVWVVAKLRTDAPSKIRMSLSASAIG